MIRVSSLAVPLSGLVLAACTPACTPPQANAPASNEARADEPATGSGAAPASINPHDMIMEAKGVDVSKLTDAQRMSFFQLINGEPSACGKSHSLAKSLRDDSTCRDSLIVCQFAADRLATGASPSDVKEELEFVVDSLQPRTIATHGRPTHGNERAPVTVVVFADFECPHCKSEAPLIRQAVDQFRGRAKLVFKHFPLAMHPRAKVAAIATEAGHEQGKFWAMHDIVFAHQTELSDQDLLRYAEQAGLDMAKFKEAFAAERTKAAVETDRADGEKLDIQGTPAVFVNGRYMNELLFGGTVTGWIDDALRR